MSTQPSMNAYVVVSRNGTGRKIRRTLVARATWQDAERDRPRWLLHNPFWQFVAVDHATLADLWDTLDGFYHPINSTLKLPNRGEEIRRAAEALGPEGVALHRAFLAHVEHGAERPGRPS